MGFGQKAVPCVVLLTMLITVCPSLPIVQNISTKLPRPTTEKITEHRTPNNTTLQMYNDDIEPGMGDNDLTPAEETANITAQKMLLKILLQNLNAVNNFVTCENCTKLVDSTGTNSTAVRHNDDDEVAYLTLRFDHEFSDTDDSLGFNYDDVESLDAHGNSTDVTETHDTKTRLCVSVEQLPSRKAATTKIAEKSLQKMVYDISSNVIPSRRYYGNIEPGMDDNHSNTTGETGNNIEIMDPTLVLTERAKKNLVLCEKSAKLVASNGTKLTSAVNNDDDEVISLRLKFDPENPDGNFSFSVKYGDAKTMDITEKFKDVLQNSERRLDLRGWNKSELEAHVRLTIESFPNDVENGNEPPGTLVDKMAQYRLPRNALPVHYYIRIEPSMDDKNLTWTGVIIITIDVIVSTSVLTLHAHKNLVIDENSTKLTDSGGSELKPVEHNRDDVTEFLELQFNYEIPVGPYVLTLKYRGEETVGAYDESEYYDDLSVETERIPDGFYKASRNVDQENRMIAGTHFEATAARRAFPCWDEPGLKASFLLAIKHSSNYTAISNMPEIERLPTADGKVMSIFDLTPSMSTYLLTFVISDYQTVFNEHRNVSLHASGQALKEATHLLDLTPKVVKVMESYTGFPFGLPRVGSALLPIYRTAATEHWGLVSYKESSIRYNPTINTTAQHDAAHSLIAHELAHAWFGNRVTPQWWNDLWLSEGFATYFADYIMDEIDENWRGLEWFVVNTVQDMLNRDNGEHRPVRWTPITNADIGEMFNIMVYAKAAVLLHMFRNVLGDSVFRAGVQKYIADHSFGTAAADDLIIAFQEAYDKNSDQKKPLNLRGVMMPWLVQRGYPMVSVIRNYTTGNTEVSQKSTIPGDNTTEWWIPLNYATKSSPNFTSTLPTSWISGKEDRVTIDQIDKDDWIVCNVQASGFYRINYDDENWNRLVDYLNTDDYRNIHVLNRAQLIGDAFYLTQLEPDRYFNIFYRLMKYLSREVEYLAWRSAINVIEQIEGSLRNTETHELFVGYICELMRSYVEEVGFEVRETDDRFMKLSRTDVIGVVCRIGHTGCSEHAARKLMKLAENPVENRLHPDTINFVYCAGLRGLDDEEMMSFAKWAYEHARDVFIDNMDCTENHKIQRNMFYAMGTNNTDMDEPYKLFTKLLKSTEENFNFAIDFFVEKHEVFNMSDYWNYVPSIVDDILAEVNTRARLEKFKQVWQLDVLIENPEIAAMNLSASAEDQVISYEANSDPLLPLWYKQLSGDKLISESQRKLVH